ncbi:hypothetical protein [Spirosoma pollinicola]|uniref:Uncharacterized protein n=1 Tax=Spirosoma pollinicola TaxID=2057025 RepID=A0A2K8Z0U3_9BACT|nr:hypothetical protein [Spirosoma pollinicola]AUD03469.1 hypothetical protein CWM47_17515 [Spirosoma pollinicola]
MEHEMGLGTGLELLINEPKGAVKMPTVDRPKTWPGHLTALAGLVEMGNSFYKTPVAVAQLN